MTFLDTNVLLYALSTDPRESSKSDAARRILRRGDLAVSVQVLQEFYVQATRPTRPQALSHAEAARLIELWLRFEVVENSVPLLRRALRIRDQHQISYWDAAVIAAAAQSGASELLTEDLNTGQVIEGVRLVNPFA